MEISKVTLWGLNKMDKWVKRVTFEYNHQFIWNRREHANQFEEKHEMVHAFFPKGVNPNDYPVIFEMLDIIKKRLKGFYTDFYYHDCISLFMHDQEVIWSVRESGTYMFAVNGEHDSEKHKKSELLTYSYGEGCRYSYYHIKDGVIKRISYEKGLSILENKPVKKAA